MKLLKLIILYTFLLANLFTYAQKPNPSTVEWILSEMVTNSGNGLLIKGNPQIISCPYGKALHFNGSTDGIFLDQMPLDGLKQFTIEVVMRLESGGNFEQRFFHCGEIRGSRVLLETRSTKTNWYFDAFIKSGNQQKTLIDSTLTHPLDRWYHLVFVVDRWKLTTYVNGKKELENQIDLVPLMSGKTSIGVRLNEQSWFKGTIYKIRISPEALSPNNFMTY
jgi:Concanavalin A-like lectin/glucanases superfamily